MGDLYTRGCEHVDGRHTAAHVQSDQTLMCEACCKECRRPVVCTDNDFAIGVQGGRKLAPMLPMVITSRQQGYRTAAWIKIMSMRLPDEEVASTYDEVEQAIKAT